jgi:hypothetical protein
MDAYELRSEDDGRQSVGLPIEFLVHPDLPTFVERAGERVALAADELRSIERRAPVTLPAGHHPSLHAFQITRECGTEQYLCPHPDAAVFQERWVFEEVTGLVVEYALTVDGLLMHEVVHRTFRTGI